MAEYFVAELYDVEDDAEIHRNSIGGHPILPVGVKWPICGKTGEKMVLFLQFDLDPKFGLPFPSNSHFSVFMSPKVNEVPLNDYFPNGEPMPERFWEQYGPHLKVFLHQNIKQDQPLECDPYLKYKRIEFVKRDLVIPEGRQIPKGQHIFIGGEPLWMQSPEMPLGHNGEILTLVCQISDLYEFNKRDSAPEQESYSMGEYSLFVAGHIYFYASPELTHPEAIFVTVQE